ncbi:MAG: thermonuclease family protein, partial [Aestuariivirgaceae bacterium]
LIRTFGSQTVFTSVQVVDGDSLRNGVEDIRLHGIDAPEYRQTCRDGDGNSYACGKQAARHLRKLINNAPVSCQVIDTDRYGRTIGVCSANGVELNQAMVKAGWAVAYTSHSLGYVLIQDEARQARRGIWQGAFEQPEDWRDANRAGLSASQLPTD